MPNPLAPIDKYFRPGIQNISENLSIIFLIPIKGYIIQNSIKKIYFQKKELK